MSGEKQHKPWFEKRQLRLLVASATQFEAFSDCARKWWLSNVRGLKVPPTTSQAFGTILHGVCERYLKADDLGRDRETGQPVDLYPPGWTVAVSKFTGEVEGSVDAMEADLIQRLVTAAIESGVLARLPERVIENQFRETLAHLPCPACKGTGRKDISAGSLRCETCDGDGKGTHIQVQGFIDYEHAYGIQDHKTVKKIEYAKSPKKLAANIQMLIYAKVKLEKLRANHRDCSEVTIRHNVFCKDPARVRKVETTLTAEEIDTAWENLKVQAMWMDYYRTKANRWSDLPEPKSPASCNKYGGCEFIPICAGKESEESMERRLAVVTKTRYTEEQLKINPVPLTINGTPRKEDPMTSAPSAPPANAFAAALAASRGGPVPSGINPPAPAQFAPQQAPAQPQYAPPPQPQPQAQPQYAPPPAQAPAPQPQYAPPPQAPAPAQANVTTPPWAVPGCTACGGWGFNTQGQPCRICDINRTNAGQASSSAFNVQNLGNGYCSWSHKEQPQINGISPLAPASTAPVVADERSNYRPQPQAQAPAQAPLQPPAQAPQSQPQAPQAQQPGEDDDEKGTRGRKKKSFILMVNCVPARGVTGNGDRRVIFLTQILTEVQAQIADAMKAPSFFDLDPFQRRDLISRRGPDLAARFETAIVCANGLPSGQSDYRALVDAIRPYAGMEVVAELNG